MNLFYKINLQAFNIISIVLYHSSVQRLGKSWIAARTSSLLMHLITRVTSTDTSSLLLKRFPWSRFFNFGNKSKSGRLISGLHGVWGSTCHPYISKISDIAPEAWGRVLSCKMRTWAANMADHFLANLWTQNILQKLSVVCRCYSAPRRHSVCCYHSFLVMSHNHHELNFR
jgi:hypothetical protein